MNLLWQSRSQCGSECVSDPAGTSRARQALRLFAVAGALLAGTPLVPVLPLVPGRARLAAVRALARLVLRATGVRLVVRGRLPRRRALLVANHISWLDVIAILAVVPTHMLAKSDVRQWPLVGAIATAGGSIFVDRTRPRKLPETVAEVAAVLRGGGVVTVFPEGTTSCGAAGTHCGGPIGRFRPAMFQAAVDTGAVVVPAAIGYRTGQETDGTTAAAFVGDEHLWASLRRVVAVRTLVVTVVVSPALHPDGLATRRALARIAESAVWMPPPSLVGMRPPHPESATRPDVASGSHPSGVPALDLAA